VPVADTTEIRWFFPGPLPTEVRRWFTGSTGVGEERRDTYLLTGRVDEGVKYRGGEILELKVRRQVDRWIELGGGLAGSPEEWWKWSSADGPVQTSPQQGWVDIDKVIVKRRFSPDGSERAFSPSQDGGPACDIEVADVSLDGVATWTLALAAFGPLATRRTALVAGWQALRASASTTVSVRLDAGRAMSYPEWLAREIDETSGTRLAARETSRATCEL
jgi:hypothetical protein